MIFDCSLCEGICCYNPPQIANKREYEFAKSQGAEIVAVKISSEKYALAIAKKNRKCPFLTETNKCSIYENRFESCRNYKCGFLNKKIEGPINPAEFAVYLNSTNGSNTEDLDIFLVSKKFIKNEHIRILKPSEIIETLSALDFDIFFSIIQKINNKINI